MYQCTCKLKLDCNSYVSIIEKIALIKFLGPAQVAFHWRWTLSGISEWLLEHSFSKSFSKCHNFKYFCYCSSIYIQEIWLAEGLRPHFSITFVRVALGFNNLMFTHVWILRPQWLQFWLILCLGTSNNATDRHSLVIVHHCTIITVSFANPSCTSCAVIRCFTCHALTPTWTVWQSM